MNDQFKVKYRWFNEEEYEKDMIRRYADYGYNHISTEVEDGLMIYTFEKASEEEE